MLAIALDTTNEYIQHVYQQWDPDHNTHKGQGEGVGVGVGANRFTRDWKSKVTHAVW